MNRKFTEVAQQAVQKLVELGFNVEHELNPKITLKGSELKVRLALSYGEDPTNFIRMEVYATIRVGLSGIIQLQKAMDSSMLIHLLLDPLHPDNRQNIPHLIASGFDAIIAPVNAEFSFEGNSKISCGRAVGKAVMNFSVSRPGLSCGGQYIAESNIHLAQWSKVLAEVYLTLAELQAANEEAVPQAEHVHEETVA